MTSFPVRSILTAVALVSLGSGCAENESSIFIAGLISPDEECVYNVEGNTQLVLTPNLDPGARRSYGGVLLVGNQLVSQGNRDKLRTETSRISIRGAVVRITTGEGAPITEYTASATGSIPPSSGDTPGFGAVTVPLIPPPPGQSLPSGIVDVTVQVFGDTLGGEEIESGEYLFPINILPPDSLLQDCTDGEGVDSCTPGQDGQPWPRCPQ